MALGLGSSGQNIYSDRPFNSVEPNQRIYNINSSSSRYGRNIPDVTPIPAVYSARCRNRADVCTNLTVHKGMIYSLLCNSYLHVFASIDNIMS